jgi:hypothetical protein
MKILIIVLACALSMPLTASFAIEQYKCTLIITEDTNNPKLDAGQYVDLTIGGKIVRPIIHITDASKDLTFKTCKALKDDGSNFYNWFKTECRDLAAADGSSFTVDPYMMGAYAGISPVIDKQYSAYEAIADISKKLGIEIPRRTFVIYADRQSVYEFFCYPEKPKP